MSNYTTTDRPIMVAAAVAAWLGLRQGGLTERGNGFRNEGSESSSFGEQLRLYAWSRLSL